MCCLASGKGFRTLKLRRKVFLDNGGLLWENATSSWNIVEKLHQVAIALQFLRQKATSHWNIIEKLHQVAIALQLWANVVEGRTFPQLQRSNDIRRSCEVRLKVKKTRQVILSDPPEDIMAKKTNLSRRHHFEKKTPAHVVTRHTVLYVELKKEVGIHEICLWQAHEDCCCSGTGLAAETALRPLIAPTPVETGTVGDDAFSAPGQPVQGWQAEQDLSGQPTTVLVAVQETQKLWEEATKAHYLLNSYHCQESLVRSTAQAA